MARFEVQKQGAVDVVHGDAPVNREHVEELSDVFQRCLGAGQPMVVFDMQGVQLIDGAGLELLLDVQDHFAALGGSMKLSAPNAVCRDALIATGVGSRFDIFDEANEAVGSFLQ